MPEPFADRKRSFYFWKNPEKGCSLPGWAGLWVGTDERTAAAPLPARRWQRGRGSCASRAKVSGRAGAELRALWRKKAAGQEAAGPWRPPLPHRARVGPPSADPAAAGAPPPLWFASAAAAAVRAGRAWRARGDPEGPRPRGRDGSVPVGKKSALDSLTLGKSLLFF